MFTMIITNVESKKVIENKKGKADGDPIVQWDINKQLHQKWLLEGTGDGDGSYFIVNVESKKVIENKKGKADGDPIVQWDKNKQLHQKWLISSAP